MEDPHAAESPINPDDHPVADNTEIASQPSVQQGGASEASSAAARQEATRSATSSDAGYADGDLGLASSAVSDQAVHDKATHAAATHEETAQDEATHRAAVTRLARIDLLRSYSFFFDQREWPLIVLAGSACVLAAQFLPILPYMLFGGYLFLVFDSQTASPNQPIPTFHWERFADYLGRAVWGLLLLLPASIVLLLVHAAAYFGGIFGLVALSRQVSDEAFQMTLWVGLPITALLWLGCLIHVLILLQAALVATHLRGSLDGLLKWRWLVDYLRRTWLEQYAVALFGLLSSTVLTFVGLLLFCVGSYVAQAISLLAVTELNAQLYRLYLTRGGTPMLPLRETHPTSEDEAFERPVLDAVSRVSEKR